MSDEKHFAHLMQTIRRHTKVSIAASVVAILALLMLALYLLTEPDRIRHAITEYKARAAKRDEAAAVEDAGAELTLPEISVIATPPKLALALDTWADPQRAALSSVVSIYVPTSLLPPYNRWSESGFLVQEGVVMATAHLLYEHPSPMDAEVHVRCDDKDVVAAITNLDFSRDVLVLQAPGCDGEKLAFNTKALDVNKHQLIATGYDFGNDTSNPDRYMRYTSVIPGAALPEGDERNKPFADFLVASIREHKYAPLIGLSGECKLGHSGSPIIDAKGAIVGMITVLEESHGRTYMIPAVTMLEALNARRGR